MCSQTRITGNVQGHECIHLENNCCPFSMRYWCSCIDFIFLRSFQFCRHYMEFLKEQQTAGTHASCLTAEIDTRRVKEEKAEHRYLRACLRCLCNKLEIEPAPKKKKKCVEYLLYWKMWADVKVTRNLKFSYLS